MPTNSMTPQPKEAGEMKAELLPTRCVGAWEKIDALMRHSTDDAVTVIEDIADICIEALTRTPPSASIEVTEDEVERLLCELNTEFGDGPLDANAISYAVRAVHKAIYRERARQKDQG
jgi:hypothetical protein